MKTADILEYRGIYVNQLPLLRGTQGSQWERWINNTDGFHVKKTSVGSEQVLISTDGTYGSQISGSTDGIWSAELPLVDETNFTLTLEAPAYDMRVYLGLAAIPRAGADSLVPKVQTSTKGWTIADDCKDSLYYLDVSGEMSCVDEEREDGTFRPNVTCERNQWQCRDCVDGANCMGPVVWPNVGVQKGWWRSHWNNSIFLPCGESSACLGVLGNDASKRQCGSTSPPKQGTCNEEQGYTNLCAEAFNQWKLVKPEYSKTPIPDLKQCNLCTRCLQTNTTKYGRSFGSTTKCEICWSPEQHLTIAIVLISIFVLTIAWYIRANRKTGYRSNQNLLKRALNLKGKSDGVVVQSLDERAKYKLALVATANKCIVILCYSGTLTIPWHPIVQYVFVFYKGISTFVGDYIRLDCLSKFNYEETFPFIFKDALFWVVAFPTILVGFTLITIVAACSTKARKINGVAAFMAIIETLYPTICAKTFSLFACQWIGDRRFMVFDMDVECYVDDRYNTFVVLLAVPAMICFIAGIPILSAVFVWSQRNKTHSNIAGRVFYRLMTVGLRPSHYLWRSMEKFRCALVVFVLVYTSQFGPFIHVFAYVGMLTATHMFEVYEDPYRMIRVKDKLHKHHTDTTTSHTRQDDEFKNVFQTMKNVTVMVALGTIFMGSLELGANSNKEWRKRWLIDWATLNTAVAVLILVVNVCYMYWLVSTVMSQFGTKLKKFQRHGTCCKKKRKTKLASITPELAQRRQSKQQKILKALSESEVAAKASELTNWKDPDKHSAASVRIMALAATVMNSVPEQPEQPEQLEKVEKVEKVEKKTVIVPKPSEEVVIQRVIEAGHEFENTAIKRKQKANELQRQKLLDLAKLARVRIRKRKKKTTKVKVKKKKTNKSKVAPKSEKTPELASNDVVTATKEEENSPATLPAPKVEGKSATSAEAKKGKSSADVPTKNAKKKKLIIADSDSDEEVLPKKVEVEEAPKKKAKKILLPPPTTSTKKVTKKVEEVPKEKKESQQTLESMFAGSEGESKSDEKKEKKEPPTKAPKPKAPPEKAPKPEKPEERKGLTRSNSVRKKNITITTKHHM
jgi:hypothetical protein